ncbi:Hsp20/alpha crystallin family protein [Promethearchaeum syntrophicum]|uniref:Hsp20/alpha crystallin family protein n=1 Tax=Promethearchaeum syntrophicum TaxID=2594042 RepID=A0A5B9DH19_9ARCH|nr:Hsp20/alpha crystallin family protein [Candidatus Prometheoarchaeum syntrophicum]QEE18006.1 Hsp20/alpha crystallin family protein [Candidatus Prometheoarchaeum syntrophicum]
MTKSNYNPHRGGMHFAGGACGPKFDPNFMHMMMGKWQNYMPYDLEETKTEYIVTMPLPGLEVKDIEVSVRGSEILIEAKKEQQPIEGGVDQPIKLEKQASWILNRPVSVKIAVQSAIDPEKVKARLKLGVLKVNFTKLPKTTIDIDEE